MGKEEGDELRRAGNRIIPTEQLGHAFTGHLIREN